MVDVFKHVVPDAKLSVDASKPTSQTSDIFLDLTRAKTELGYEAEYDLPAAVSDFVGWYRRVKKRG